MCTDPGWFIYQLEVRIWFWSSPAWPPTFLFSSFSTLYSINSLWRTGTIVFPKLYNPPSLLSPPPSNGLEINRPPGGLNREETSLRRVAMEAKFLDDNKPKKSLKSLFALFQTSPILFNFIEFGKSWWNFLWDRIYHNLSLKNESDKFCVVFTYSIKRACEIRKFHVVVVQRQQRNVQNSVMHAKLLFVTINILFIANLLAVAVVIGFVAIQK